MLCDHQPHVLAPSAYHGSAVHAVRCSVNAVDLTWCSCQVMCCRWWEKNQSQPTPEAFHTHVEQELQQWRRCVLQEGTAGCVRRYHPQQLVKGMYSEFLQVGTFNHFLLNSSNCLLALSQARATMPAGSHRGRRLCRCQLSGLVCCMSACQRCLKFMATACKRCSRCYTHLCRLRADGDKHSMNLMALLAGLPAGLVEALAPAAAPVLAL